MPRGGFWLPRAARNVGLGRLGREFFRREGGRAHFFRFTDYVTRSYPEAGELLFAGDALAAICEEVLRGPTQRIALTQVFTAASQLLSSLDSYEMSEPATGMEEERHALERKKEQRLNRAQAGYRRALTRAGRAPALPVSRFTG